jgi:hypothetical protein
LRRRKAVAAAAAAANDTPADAPADAPAGAEAEASNGVTEIMTTIATTELNVLRAIEVNHNALWARLDEHHAQQMAWTERKIREYRESGYGYGTTLFFVIIFLMILATYTESEGRRRGRWW